ncbi:MAG: lanthionine synthetase C family protein [Chlamydiales bacterium]|nr:lanthionine synthetase C family protein [Chlamydiales bacterium]
MIVGTSCTALVKHIARNLYHTNNLTEANLLAFPLSLSHGYPSLVLLFACLDELFPDEGWDKAAHTNIIKIKESIEMQGLSNLSLFSGLSGICFAIDAASRNKTRYQKFIQTLHTYLINQISKSYFNQIEEKVTLGLPIHPELWEIISGLSGIGIYCLKAIDNEDIYNLLTKILSSLVKLATHIEIGGHKIPAWYHPSYYQFIDQDKITFPFGNFNLGMAHGIAGVMALLSIAKLNGISVKDQEYALKYFSNWLLSKKIVKNGSISWPDRISFQEEITHSKTKTGTMNAWCYGTAGVARSLYLCGKAIDSKTIQEEAIAAFESMSDVPKSPTFCHGIAGLLTLTDLMAIDSRSFQLKQRVEFLKSHLLDTYKEDRPIGFWDLELTTSNTEPQEREKIGLLDGCVGVLLTLLGPEVYPKWQPLFLINERLS